jgi:hypothetical protein
MRTAPEKHGGRPFESEQRSEGWHGGQRKHGAFAVFSLYLQ